MIKDILSPDEEIKHEFTVGKSYIKINLIIWFVVSLFLFLIPLPFAFFYYSFYLKRAKQYYFTNKRVIIKNGWLDTNVASINYDMITDITVNQKFLDKLFYKTGNIYVNTAGSHGKEGVMLNIEHPHKIKRKLEEIKSSK